MNVAQQLDMLQDLDLELDRLRGQLAAIRAQMAQPTTLQDAQTALRQAEARLQQARKQYQEREWEVRDVQARVSALEARLYGGQMSAPKELANLQREVESLKAHQARLEEHALQSLLALEEAQSSQQAAADELTRVDHAWQADHARLSSEAGALEEQIAARQARRQAQARLIDPASLSIYERLRVTKGGRAVARLVGDRCDGCRLTLPSGDAARVRTTFGLVLCVNCGRILCK